MKGASARPMTEAARPTESVHLTSGLLKERMLRLPVGTRVCCGALLRRKGGPLALTTTYFIYFNLENQDGGLSARARVLY